MKKVITVISLILIFFIIYIIQADFFCFFNIAGIKPNLFIIFILIIALFGGETLSFPIAIIFGLILDLLTGKAVGISSFIFVLIVVISKIYNKNFTKDSKLTIMLMVASTTVIYEVGIYIFNIVKFGTQLEIFPFMKILIIEVIFNTILTIILYPIIKKTGLFLEDTFKEQKMLTKYF